jgi:hypothetical protein
MLADTRCCSHQVNAKQQLPSSVLAPLFGLQKEANGNNHKHNLRLGVSDCRQDLKVNCQYTTAAAIHAAIHAAREVKRPQPLLAYRDAAGRNIMKSCIVGRCGRQQLT